MKIALYAGLAYSLVGLAAAGTTTKHPTSTCTKPIPSPTSLGRECTDAEVNGNAVQNGKFQDGFKYWKLKTTSKNPQAAVTGGDGAIFNFPKGKKVTTTLSQTIIGCSQGVEELSIFYRQSKGSGCIGQATIPVVGQFWNEKLEVRENITSAVAISDDYGPGTPQFTAVLLPVEIKITCDGSAASTVLVEEVSFWGIG